MEDAALIVIDMQNAYFRSDALAEQKDGLISRINELIAFATNHNRPIFSIITAHDPDRSTWTLNMLDDGQDYLLHGSDEAKTVSGLKVESAETIKKTRDSAFFGTDLEKTLATQHIETLIICGVSTHGCILQTAADAYANNLRVILVGDAIATHDLIYHESTLELLKQEYRQKVIRTDEVLAGLDG